ncbi:hypothetical protein PENTCL1PPCAC_21159, partial [Pristionchus entomophagus]
CLERGGDEVRRDCRLYCGCYAPFCGYRCIFDCEEKEGFSRDACFRRCHSTKRSVEQIVKTGLANPRPRRETASRTVRRRDSRGKSAFADAMPRRDPSRRSS